MPPESPAAAAPMVWWGWGDPGRPRSLPRPVERFLDRAIGLGPPSPPVRLADVLLPAARLAPKTAAHLAAIVGDAHVRTDRAARVTHAAGKAYHDLVRLRAGDAADAPDAVVRPATHAEVASVLALCAASRVAVVPFGGGTSVVGGVAGLPGALDAVVCLDLRRMRRLLALDRRSLTAVFEPGMRGAEAEAALRRHNLTLGHFPQSHEYATLGGYAATRSSGQASTGYGRFDDLVLGVRAATPAGEVDLAPAPASAAGPDLRHLLVGSEGTLGVLTRLDLQVRPAPAARRYEAWLLPSLAAGLDALRRLAQAGLAPDVARLSDAEETRVTLALARQPGTAGTTATAAVSAYARLRGVAGGCLAVLGWEGTAPVVARRRAVGARALRRAGGAALGAGAGRSWLRSRFSGPYLRDSLLDRGLLVDTLETAAPWSRVEAVHAAVGDTIRRVLADRGTPPLVGCHVSHLYVTGASLYFTVLARQQTGAALDQWRAFKRAATDAIVAAGATLTHHHGVGRDHRPWMSDEIGPVGVAALRAAKARLDPVGIMNPGKLLPDPGAEAP